MNLSASISIIQKLVFSIAITTRKNNFVSLLSFMILKCLIEGRKCMTILIQLMKILIQQRKSKSDFKPSRETNPILEEKLLITFLDFSYQLNTRQDMFYIVSIVKITWPICYQSFSAHTIAEHADICARPEEI